MQNLKEQKSPITRDAHIRIRLTPEELEQLETVRQFLGLRSVSAVASRLALWNAKMLSAALTSDSDQLSVVEPIADVVGDAVKLSLRRAILEGK